MTVLPTKYSIGNKVYDRDLSTDLYIDKGDINSSIVNHAQQFAWYATAYELCTLHESRAKDALEELEARLDHAIRMEADGANVKMTETKVKNTVLTRSEYKEALEAYRTAQLNAGLAKSARDAMVHRKDMLVTLGANYRAEGNSDVTLRTQQLK